MSNGITTDAETNHAVLCQACGVNAATPGGLCPDCAAKADLGQLKLHPDLGWCSDFDAYAQVEAMVDALRMPFPSNGLSLAGDVDMWRGLMWKARRAMLLEQAMQDSRKPLSEEDFDD